MLLWDVNGSMPSSIKVTTGYHSHIFRTSRSKVAAWRSIIADDLNLQGGLGVTKRRDCIFFITSVRVCVAKA